MSPGRREILVVFGFLGLYVLALVDPGLFAAVLLSCGLLGLLTLFED
tara:strand:- start:237 stop:377 length:141 start_codon:yes stop_codon:yes gene_type:complete